MPHPRQKLVLVDAHALLHRSYHALPATMSTGSGEPTNALYGFCLTILTAIETFRPTHLAICFDDKGPTLRAQRYEAYKAHRKEIEDALIRQLNRARDIPEVFGVRSFFGGGHEADDYLGALADCAKKSGTEVVILTGDKDTYQLVDDLVSVCILKTGVKDTMLMTPARILQITGLRPDQMIDYKALRGDPSDNIPGVPGIGEVTATKLLKTHGTLEEVYAHLDDDPMIKGKLKERLIEHKELSFLSRELATIRSDVPIECNTEDLAFDPDIDRLAKLFEELEFRSLLPRLEKIRALYARDADGAPVAKSVPKSPAPKEDTATMQPSLFAPAESAGATRPVQQNNTVAFSHTLVQTPAEFQDFLDAIKGKTLLAIDTETESLDALSVPPCGISVSVDGKMGYYLNLGHGAEHLPLDLVQRGLGPILANPRVTKVAHNAKFDLHVLRNAGMDVLHLEDTLLMAYLLAPGARSLRLDTLAQQEFGYTMQPITDLIGKGKKQIPFSHVDPVAAAFYAAEDAVIAFRLRANLKSRLEAVDQWGFLEKLEFPLVPILADMERAGVQVDVPFLETLAVEIQKELKTIEESIYAAVGHPFNLNAPRQVEEVLFTELQLTTKGIKRTASGGALSTAADELAKLDHPVASFMLEFRELEKLRSTYIDALPLLVREDGRVHTTYNQAVAATGRLSSTDPNLQNIPVRTELGRRIRKAFVAPQGRTLVAADYSQIELRVLAHLSDDPALIQVYQEGRDIHAQTAAFIYGVDPADVTKAQRGAAKVVNFGILYGMGPQRLARENKLSVAEAKGFIDRYYSSYPRVSAWMDETLARAHETGYVETLFGRRRYLPDIQGDRPQFIAQAERMAINHPVQGTAADLLKLAMIALAARLEHRTDVRLLLQVHDELVLEVDDDAVAEIATHVRDVMGAASTLRVPLVVDVQTGPTWGELAPWRA